MAYKTMPPPPIPGVYIIEEDAATADLLEKAISSTFRNRIVTVACRSCLPISYEASIPVRWVILNPETGEHSLQDLVQFIPLIFGQHVAIILHSDLWKQHLNEISLRHEFAYRDIGALLSLMEYLCAMT